MNSTNIAVKTKDLIKNYDDGKILTRVLKGINIEIKTGEFVAIMGRSGAGKSTLLYQLGLLDIPTGGKVWLEGTEVTGMSTVERGSFRLTELGYVFQDYALLPELSALENVALPLLMKGASKKEAYAKSEEVLEKVGMKGKENNLPSELSGGQQQRVSIARAVAHSPKILFADEPTANLDSYSGTQVMQLFKDLNSQGQTIVMVTHEEDYGKLADRIIFLTDGLVAEK